MAEGLFVTIVGGKHYSDSLIFRAGQIVRLIKDVHNDYDDEAIAVELPVIGKVGYVANSTQTVARGTMSAGRVYDLFEKDCFGIIWFVLKKDAIVQLITGNEEITFDISIHMEQFSSE